MTEPRSLKRLHTIIIWLSAGPVLFLAVLLLGSGVFFFAEGNDTWNDTIGDVREVADSGFILYSNLQYAKERLLVGMSAFFIGMFLFFSTIFVIVQKQKK